MAANSEKSARGRGRPFEKGKSGNPAGRPKQTQEEKDALAMIRALAPEAAECLKNILHDKSARADTKLRAVEIILERTYGKPNTVDINIENRNAPIYELLKKLDGECDV